MKTNSLLFIGLALLAGDDQTEAQNAQFFRLRVRP